MGDCSLQDRIHSEVRPQEGGRPRRQSSSSRERLLNAIVFTYIIAPPQLRTLQFGQRRVVADLFDAYQHDHSLLPIAGRDEISRVEADETAIRGVVCDYVAGDDGPIRPQDV